MSNMKKIFSLAIIMIVVTIAVSCNGNKNKNENAGQNKPAMVDEADSTIYGRCGEGTSMNMLQLLTDKGDTLSFTLISADTTANVQGGLLAGDRLAVLACKDADGEMFANTVINLTTLLGKWSDINRTFDIQEGGTVECSNQEPKPYVDWRILNGKLILTSDTFSIYKLDPDSLMLENNQGIYAYKRVMK